MEEETKSASCSDWVGDLLVSNRSLDDMLQIWASLLVVIQTQFRHSTLQQ